MNVNEKILELRKLLDHYGLDAYIVPSPDPHMSEYVAEHWKARSWISGFTGSAGTFVVTKKESGLWTDGRYFIQAENQLEGTEIKLFKMGNTGVPTYTEWIESVLKQGECVGFSGKMISQFTYKEMEDKFSNKGITINAQHDLIDEIWKDRPEIPATQVFSHDICFTGLSALEKINKVRDEMKKVNAGYYALSSLDDIAWLFNIRGDDVPYVSVTVSYALISMTEAFLFINSNKVPLNVKKKLNENNVEVLEYEDIKDKLAKLDKAQGVAFDSKRTNRWIFDSINPGCKKIEIDEITTILKGVKNETELTNIRQCQISDGIAMVKFLIWLENNVEKEEVSEITVDEKLEFFRRQQRNSLGPSFKTIAGYKEHGAMMHYTATEESRYVLENKGLMVVDSGGQYLNGTTDITRTVVFDDVSDEEIFDFTMVLKANISLSSAKFLYGATGSNLDILARKPLWEIGLDYKCGTGHGVGYCLSVHEGPHGFSQVPNKVKLEKGMIITIEPGIYREGKHGVRIENMVLVIEDEKSEYGQFLRFEPISYCPISLKGINPELLTDHEIKWVNNYHDKVYERLSPYLDSDEKEWLKKNTRSISKK
ncbi:MAG: peptidase [Eubacterium sp.]|nr:peptidase [Eubacterium sp.]